VPGLSGPNHQVVGYVDVEANRLLATANESSQDVTMLVLTRELLQPPTCFQMTCSQCGTHFCYRCFVSIDPTDPYLYFIGVGAGRLIDVPSDSLQPLTYTAGERPA
jgi:hypothetical protein